MRWEPVGGARQEREQTRQMREMSGEQDVARFSMQPVANPMCGIIRLEIARRREISQRVARTPERLRGLLRAELAAVPDDRGFGSACRRVVRQALDGSLPDVGQRPARVDLGADRVAVMH